ncbi:MAG: SIS domain-containing protein [Candidatus Dormibacteria bacterium]
MSLDHDPLPAGFPEWREGPPWVMAEMVASEPRLASQILAEGEGRRLVSPLIAAALASGSPVAVTGCGTSEHAAMAFSDLVGSATGRRSLIHPRQALEAALDPWPGLCVAISHEGETAATVAAIEAARGVGADTALITAAPASSAGRAVRELARTPAVDRSWCHTVGYLSPILVGADVAADLAGGQLDPGAPGEYLHRCLAELGPGAELAGTALAHRTSVTCLGAGTDYVAARELALKIAEGSRVPALSHQLETFLHGHLAAVDASTGVVAVLTDPWAGPRLLERARQVLAAARLVGSMAVLIAGPFVPADFAGQLLSIPPLRIPPAPGIDPRVAATLGAAMGIQLLALGLATARGTNPDLIRREELAYREAASQADGTIAL